MNFYVGGGNSTAPSKTATNNGSIVMSNDSKGWLVGLDEVPCPGAATVSQFKVNITNTPGTSKQYVFDVTKNGSTTGLTVTLSGTTISASDLTNSFTYSAGDTIGIKSTPTGTPAATGNINWSVLIQTTDGTQHIFGSVSATSTTTKYRNLMSEDSWQGSAALADCPMCIGGTFSNLYVTDTNPGVLGDSHTYTLFVANSASVITCTINSPHTSGSDTTHTRAVSEGAIVCLEGVNGGTVDMNPSWGICFTPNRRGLSIIMHGGDGNPSNSATNYLEPSAGGNLTVSATEANVQRLMDYFAVFYFRCYKVTAPGSGKTYTFTVRRNGVDTSLTVPMTGTSGSFQNIGVGKLVVFMPGDLMSVSSVPSSTPTAGTGLGWSMAGIVNPNYDTVSNTYFPTSL